MAVQPSRFEPQKISAGDTISFLKGLPDYPASAGWALEYELAGDLAYQFTSTAVGDSHQVTVDAAVTALWIPGDYELLGWAVNAGTLERQQIYQAPLVVQPNVPAGDVAQKTHAQKMLELVESVMLGKAAHDILESDVEGTRIKRLSPAELREEHAYWRNLRENEIDGERAAANLPNRRKIKARFQVKNPGVPIGFGPPIFPRP